MGNWKNWLVGILINISYLFSDGYSYEIPAHLKITLEAGKVWEEIPQEVKDKLDSRNKLDAVCKAKYDNGDDIYIGSGEEDLGESPFPCTGLEQAITNEGRNSFFEHFWDPDFPRLTPSNQEQRGYNCGELGDGYNLGLPDIVQPACGDHFDSAYRTAQDEWNKAIILYRTGRVDEAYYKLGLVAHLLEDMALPAHVHLVPHPQGFIKKIPKTSPLAGPDLYESFVKRKIVRRYPGENFTGQEYKPECFPNLPCDFDWSKVHPNPTDLFKLFWYTAQKTQYWASRTTGAFGNAPLSGIGNGAYVDLNGEVNTFNPSLWEGEASPISIPGDLTGKKKEVKIKLQQMSDALIPHTLKAVAGLYRLFWLETHPAVGPVVFEGLGVDFFPSGFSADGSVIVGCLASTLGCSAVRWNETGGLQLLGDLPGATSSVANAVSADGKTIVGLVFLPGREAFRWTDTEGMVDLGDLPGGIQNSEAFGISADGSTIVGTANSGIVEAFRWTQVEGMKGIGTLGNFPASEAFDVSADGSFIVGYSFGASGREAFRWDLATGIMMPLGDLPGGAFDSIARKISSDGSVIAGDSQVAFGRSAFRWTQAGGMENLGNLPGGDQTEVRGVSGNGSIVVGVDHFCCPGFNQIFVWDGAGGMRFLADILANSGIDLTGWILENAVGISPDGSIIVGKGINPNGQGEVWRIKNFRP